MKDSNFPIKNQDVSSIQVVSGNGAYHSESHTAKNPAPYLRFALDVLNSMVKNPLDVPKSEAPWIIPSSTGGELARNHDFQRQHGKFHALVADLDHVGPLTSLGISTAISAIFPPGTAHYIYSTKSATPENNKSRIIVPLSVPIPGRDYSMYAQIFNDKLQAAGIEPDRATERPGQLFYLPNRGAFYDCHIQ
ncbi:hypothetical protein [Desulfocicer niacini]